jgi:DNA-binding LytR/AlgR family response regulator
MKCTTIIDKNREEEIVLYVRKRSELSDKIERLAAESGTELFGYIDKSILKLEPHEIFCFAIEDGKVFAVLKDKKARMSQRLYEIEEIFASDFLKINQSCLINVKKIEKFDVSIGGALRVTLKNGYSDYISRRLLKSVKERLGF